MQEQSLYNWTIAFKYMKCEFKPEPFSDELFMCYIPGSVIPIYLPGHHPAKERVEWVQTTKKKTLS